MPGIPNDVDIEMAEAAALSNEIGALTGTEGDWQTVASLTSWLLDDINHGGPALDSPSQGLTYILGDNPEMKISSQQFDEICWNAWQRSNKGVI